MAPYSPSLFSYACIFQNTTDGAAEHLTKLIVAGSGPYADRGQCRIYLQRLLSGEYAIEDLRRDAPQFSVDQWRSIVRMALEGVDDAG